MDKLQGWHRNGAPLELVARPLTEEAFAPYGDVVEAPEKPGRAYFATSLGNLRPHAQPRLWMLRKMPVSGLPLEIKSLERYREVLSAFKPRCWTLRLDGEEMRGTFVLAEILNTRSVGPNIVLSEEADPSDGYFTVVTAGEEHRDEVMRYLTERLEGRDSRLALPSRRARHIELQGQGDTHVDDELVRSAIPGALSIHIEPSAVE